MSGGLNPVVETLGENEDYISEEGSENGKEELTEPLLASELGGKLNLVESNTNRKSITKRQSTILSGVEEINSDATSQIMNQKITPIDTKITHKPKSKSSSIAWAFAQITGQFLVDSNYIELEQFDTLKQKIMYRTPGSAQQGGLGGGGTLSANETDFGDSQKLNSNALPVYNTPPTILFCDEELAVGESKSYTYEILLPPVLPPSHKGRAIRFTYRLLIGVQKNARSRTTQVISVPFRFFNRTNTDGTRPVYEILNPVINNKDDAIVTAEIKSKEFDIPSPFPITPQPGVFGRSNSNMSSNSRIENEFPTSTVDNVSNALQMLGKVSYDISKNNEHVAMLTLPRLGYRLGETITIVLNFGKSSIPCYHVSVFLESYETIEPSFTTKTKQAINNHTKICFGEYHSQTLNSKRTAISLIIPSKGTPDFNSTCVSHQWSLRFEFITGLDSKILATTTALDGYVNQRVMTRVDVAPFDCIIPLKVFGALKMSKQQKQVLEFNL
ncbi:Rgp1-domain-containing protein, partial [Globomyces pollinis-pini]